MAVVLSLQHPARWGADPRGMSGDTEDDTRGGAREPSLPPAVCREEIPTSALGQEEAQQGFLGRWTSLSEVEMNERAPGTFPAEDSRGPGASWMLMSGWEGKRMDKEKISLTCRRSGETSSWLALSHTAP